MRETKKILILALMAMLLAASCSKKEELGEVKEDTRDAVEVTVLTAGPQMMADVYQAVGTVKSGSRSMMSPKVMGHVLEVTVEQGDAVTAGQLLVRLDSRDIAAQVQQAKAGLAEAKQALNEVTEGISAAESGVASAKAGEELAEKTYQRFKKLKEQKSVSQQEFDQVEAQKKMAAAEAERAQRMLDGMKAKKGQVEAKIAQASQGVKQAEVMQGFAKLYAPFDGVVVSRTAEPGQLATPGAPLVVVEDNTDYRLEAQVEETYSENVKIGDPVAVVLDAIKQKQLEGTVVEIVPTVDPNTRTFMVEIALPDDSGVRSGMFGKAKFLKGESKVCRVPKGALVKKGQLEGVYVAEEDRAHFRLVKMGRDFEDGTIEILSGMTPGDALIVSNTDRLSDGRSVKIVEVREVEK